MESRTESSDSDMALERDIEDCPTSPTRQEGGRGWLICGGTFIVNFVVFGIHNSFGVIYAKLIRERKLGEVETGKWTARASVHARIPEGATVRANVHQPFKGPAFGQNKHHSWTKSSM